MNRSARQPAAWSIAARATAMTVLLVVFATACRRDDAGDNAGDSADASHAGDATTSDAASTHWSPYEGGHAISVSDEALTRRLEEAMQRARETAPEAMARWQATDAIDRPRWLIKWAAPLVNDPAGGVEYVWVLPATWSAFRIEGTLVTTPVGDIGHRAGDLVGFSSDDLADWVYRVDGTMTGPRQGGFTVEVLEERFGRPVEQ